MSALPKTKKQRKNMKRNTNWIIGGGSLNTWTGVPSTLHVHATCPIYLQHSYRPVYSWCVPCDQNVLQTPVSPAEERREDTWFCFLHSCLDSLLSLDYCLNRRHETACELRKYAVLKRDKCVSSASTVGAPAEGAVNKIPMCADICWVQSHTPSEDDALLRESITISLGW